MWAAGVQGSMGLLEDMEPGKMTDTGMYVWAGILTVTVLVASYFVALWWQRRGEKRSGRDDEA